MKINKNEKGITLVALVITILVLIILAAITVNQLTKTDIVDHGLNSAASYTEGSVQENKELQQTGDVMKNFVDEWSNK